MKEALLSAFFILITSCNPDTRWKADKISAVFPAECSRVYWPAENKFTDLELDICKAESGDQVFLTCYGVPLEAKENKLVNLEVITEKNKEIFQVYLFEGGYRVALSAEDSATLLSYIQQGESIKLKLNQYTSRIDPEGFNTKYQQL